MTVYERLQHNGIILTQSDIFTLVKKYNIKEISIFGSSIRDDFTDKSDIDLLIEFNNSENISLSDIIDIQEYFSKITNRSIDIVEPAGLINPYRRESILKSKEPLYVA
jgi:uncharacterized protein